MNWIDLILLAVLVLAGWEGWRQGFLLEVIDLATFLTALIIGLALYRPIGDWLVIQYQLPALLAKPAAFLGLWLGVQGILSMILLLIYRFLPKPLTESWLNRLAGLLPAMIKTIAASGIALTLLAAFPLPKEIKQAVSQSKFAPTLMERTSFLTQALERSLGGNFAETINFLLSPPEEAEHTARRIPAVNESRLKVEPELEDQLFDLVNRERIRVGLKSLAKDPDLQKVARAHSRDMWLRGYFSHVNPDGEDPFDRMTKAGITFIIAGENLALAPSVEIAHFGLMRSPGHRENILHSDFGRVGIGIISAGSDGIMVTQNFRD